MATQDESTKGLGVNYVPADNNAAALKPGQTLDGRYLVQKILDRGGTGVVFLASDQKLHGKQVVIKVLHEKWEDADSKTYFERKFKDEIKALARIDHPGVVGALDVGELPDGRSYLVMQYVSGVTLRTQIKPQGMELLRVARLVRQIGQALSAAHQKDVIHRDLKPANIMLQLDGDEEYVKLIDFGIATLLDTFAQAATKTTQVAGTVDYMAPEQFLGKPQAASDIYALGVIAYEMVTGRRPFNPDSPYQLPILQRAGVKINPCSLRPSLPEAAQAVTLKALEVAPQDRYKTAKEFGNALADALAGDARTSPAQALQQADSSQVPAPSRAASQSRKRAARVALLLIAGLLVAVVLSTIIWRYGKWDGQTKSATTDELIAATERRLNYSITVQKDPKSYPGSKPFLLPGEIVFSVGDQVRLNVSSPRDGYLYVINEGPSQTNGLPDYEVMFPTTIANGGSAEIKANRWVQIPPPSKNPDQDWFFFDNEAGTERIWLVWAEQNVPELEAVKGQANPKDRGVISDPHQIRSVKQYLEAQSVMKPEVEKDEGNKQTKLRGVGEVLAGLVNLEHH